MNIVDLGLIYGLRLTPADSGPGPGGEQTADCRLAVLLRGLRLLDSPNHHMVVIDRHPGVATRLLGQDSRRIEGVSLQGRRARERRDGCA